MRTLSGELCCVDAGLTLARGHGAAARCVRGRWSWLVAYDVRTAGGYRETHLRFFRGLGDGRHDEVLTVPDPFEGDVTGIAASPTGRVVVTASTARTFKVWVRCRRGTETWKCRSVGAFRGEASPCALFSGDGRAVAVLFRTA